MTKKRITISFTDNEMEFLKWIAKEDGLSLNEEVAEMAKLKLEEVKNVFVDAGWYKGRG